ncbi:MAG: hypothetical protein AAGU14_11205 [Eubacteriaceae bacterium]
MKGINMITIIDLLVQLISSMFFALGLSLVITSHNEKKLLKSIKKDDLIIRISNTSEILNNATKDLIEMQNELNTRIKIVNELKEKADDSLNLISTTEEQVNSITKLLTASYKKDYYKSSLFFLILGCILTKVVDFILHIIIQHL